MKENHTIELLASFNAKEIKAFDKFIRSPYFNDNELLISLFSILQESFIHNKSKVLCREEIFKILFGSEPFRDVKLRTLFHQLLNLIYKFIIVECLDNDFLNKNILLLKELDLKNQNKLFIKEAKRINEIIERGTADPEIYHKIYEYNNIIYNNFFRTRKLTNRQIIEHLNEISEKSIISISVYFIVQYVSLYVHLKINSIKFNFEIKEHIINRLLDTISFEEMCKLSLNYNSKDSAIIELYYKLYKLFRNTENHNMNDYYDYENVFRKCKDILDDDESSFHFSCILNYLTIYDNSLSQKNDITTELFEIYHKFIEEELYTNSQVKYLPANLYRAALHILIRKGDRELVEKFTSINIPKLQPEYRNNLYHYSVAYYNYITGDHGKALESLNKITIQYFIHKYDINILKLKLFYELGFTEEIFSNIHSYRQLLSCDEILSFKDKNCHLNFIISLNKLINLKEAKDVKEIEYSILTLEKEKEIFHKNWLIEKYKELLD